MVLDNYVEVEIDGAKYKLCLKNLYAFMAEKELASGKLLVALAHPPLAMGDLYVLFKYALMGGGHEFEEEKYFSLFISLNNAVGAVGFFNIILEVIQKAEIIGKNPKAAKKA